MCIGILLLSTLQIQAQDKPKSYKSLLWEITGNGLKKPSYLFGTMHISNKMVFHLSDSFYAAIRNADVVAIELNPDQWQVEIPRLSKQEELLKYYNATYYTDYLNEHSFTEGDFLPQLLSSLRYEPPLNDALLYRNESRMDNFQEDTYLDLYIYQTGKKLGKQAAGVETFIGAQRMMLEALVDAAGDKDKKKPDVNEQQYYELSQNMQDAYRRGDLDMLDSINKITEYAQSFTEKFLYKRNEIQAASMDSIMKQKSLFVGVGAAHLPGKRGVIELLRKKGYTLRPIYMQDRDALQKKSIDSLTVPVTFARQYAADSFYSVSVPGKLNDIDNKSITLKHYADMGNGSFYLVTRIKTNALFNGYNGQRILKIVDSLLYENIPGTILSSNAISRNGYDGIDVRNRTRKGDEQRYQIFVTPYELFIFKMGGKGTYVNGKEAETFFNSISFKENPVKSDWQLYTPPSGGFSVKMPVTPNVCFIGEGDDHLPEWKFEAVDPGTGDEYAVFRKSIYSFDFIEADTFDLMLIGESFGSNTQWEEKKESTTTFNGRPVRDITIKTKDGAYLQARALLFGPQYYLLIHRTKNKSEQGAAFFNSFAFAPFQYPASKIFTDTTLHFTVNTSVKPTFDADVMDMYTYVKNNMAALKKDNTYSDLPATSFANFISEETGEVIIVNHYQYPKYHYIKDSTKYWNSWFNNDSSLVLTHKAELNRGAGVNGWLLSWSDTGSTRQISQMILTKGMHIVTATSMTDSTLPQSTFVDNFYKTLNLFKIEDSNSLFANKQELFFKDYYNKDTTISQKAKAALTAVYYGKEGYQPILQAMAKLKPTAPDYIETKTKFITELGYINDSVIVNDVAASLKKLYLDAGDTAVFQNSALKSLARLRTANATAIFKELILQDPPAFDDAYEYSVLFNAYEDSLKLAAQLYPEILNITTIEDFKMPVRQLLASLVDSNYIKPSQYEDYLGNIYFDAKIALKKIQYANGNASTLQNEEEDYNDQERKSGTYDSDIKTYVTLLAPFYDKNPTLPKFFGKLLSLKNQQIQLNTALALLKNKQPVADSVWNDMAGKRESRAYLWSQLKGQGRVDLFPKKYQTDEAIASSLIYASLGQRMDTLVLLNKHFIEMKNKDLVTYSFKYKIKKDEDWKLAISSVKKKDKGKMAEGDYDLFFLSDKKLAASTTEINKEVNDQLRKLVIRKTKSGRQFYREGNGGSYDADLSDE